MSPALLRVATLVGESMPSMGVNRCLGYSALDRRRPVVDEDEEGDEPAPALYQVAGRGRGPLVT